MKYTLIALCPEELKPVIIDELKSLGAYSIQPSYKAISFEVSEEDYYLCHLKLRTASTLIRSVRVFSQVKPKDIAKLSQNIKWAKLFSSNKKFRVDATITDRGRHLPSSNEISKHVRVAIENDFKKQNLPLPKVDLKEPQVMVTAFYSKGILTLGFNTARMSLHKRGYRLEGHPAPVKETMASALIDFMGYDGSQAFLDPMCGSGTIAIEACYRALKKAPQIHRKKNVFGFEHLKDFNSELWRKTQDAVRKEKLESLPVPIFASDIDAKYVSGAKNNALRARVEKHIQFQEKSLFDLSKPCDSGIMLSNLPYGERIGEKESMKEFYQKIGTHLKHNFTSWKIGLFVNEESPWKFIGLHPSKKINLLNGSIKTKLLIFDIYDGSKKRKKQES